MPRGKVFDLNQIGDALQKVPQTDQYLKGKKLSNLFKDFEFLVYENDFGLKVILRLDTAEKAKNSTQSGKCFTVEVCVKAN